MHVSISFFLLFIEPAGTYRDESDENVLGVRTVDKTNTLMLSDSTKLPPILNYRGQANIESSKLAQLPSADENLPILSDEPLWFGYKVVGQLGTVTDCFEKMTEKHNVSEWLDISDQVPEDSEEYAFSYPCLLLPLGAFVYYNGSGKAIEIWKIVETGTGDGDMSFDKVWTGPVEPDKDCPSEPQGLISHVFGNAEYFCWMPECKVVTVDANRGCFMYKMRGGGNQAYITGKIGAEAATKSLLPLGKINVGIREVGSEMGIDEISQKYPVNQDLVKYGIVPNESEEYAYAYNCEELPRGGFVYYNRSGEQIRVRAIVEWGDRDVTFFNVWEGVAVGNEDCPVGSQGYHNTSLFRDVKEYCWLPYCIVAPNPDMGCFMFKMIGGVNRAYAYDREGELAAARKYAEPEQDKSRSYAVQPLVAAITVVIVVLVEEVQ